MRRESDRWIRRESEKERERERERKLKRDSSMVEAAVAWIAKIT